MNLPIDFTNRIKKQFSFESTGFLEALGEAPATSIRVNNWKKATLGYDLTGKIAWCEHGYFLPERPNFTLDPLFHAGCYYSQEASSMFLWYILGKLKPSFDNPLILDMCAAPGGKSTLMAQFFGSAGLLVSNEYVRQRAWILRENVIKWGNANSMVTNLDTERFAELGEIFDLVLVDAPCSGEGMFRKNAEAISEWSVENCNKCVDRQREILRNAYKCLAKEGILIYSTCTFNPAENEENMRWMTENFDVEIIEVEHDFAEVTNVERGYAFYPQKTRGEGFYVCVMRKTGGCRKNINPKKIVDARVNIDDYLINSDDYLSIAEDDKIYALPRKTAPIMIELKKRLCPIAFGMAVGQVGRKEFIVAEELPLYQAFSDRSFPKIEVDRMSALRYLRGEWNGELRTADGWNVVSYGGVNLGFVKAFGNRVNNYFPKNWRIRIPIA